MQYFTDRANPIRGGVEGAPAWRECVRHQPRRMSMTNSRQSEPLHSMEGALLDQWPFRETRKGAAVVAELSARAPARAAVRDLSDLDKRLWRYLSDLQFMQTEVFSLVPVYVPAHGIDRVLTFFLPKFRVAVELDELDFHRMEIEEVIAHMDRCSIRDDALREHARVLTIRCPKTAVRKDAHAVAESIHFDLGLR